jgi:hypothetical protein
VPLDFGKVLFQNSAIPKPLDLALEDVPVNALRSIGSAKTACSQCLIGYRYRVSRFGLRCIDLDQYRHLTTV